MDSYSVIFDADADADLRSVPFPFRRQINQRIYKLKREPFPPEAERVSGVQWIDVYGWFLVYAVDDARRQITILAIY